MPPGGLNLDLGCRLAWRCCRTAARGAAYGAAASKMRDLARPRVSKPERCSGSTPGVARGYTRGQSARAVLVVSDQASPRWRLTPWPGIKETVIIPGGETGSFWGGGHPGQVFLAAADAGTIGRNVASAASRTSPSRVHCPVCAVLKMKMRGGEALCVC